MAQETKWTPGPWVAKAVGGASTVLAPTMPPKNDTRCHVAYGYQVDGDYCIAYPVLHETEYGECEQTRMDYVHFGHADAHLIAAAPELYEALEDMLIEIGVMKSLVSMATGEEGFFDGLEPEIQKAETALSKARGE